MPGICVKNAVQMAGENRLRFYSFWQLQAIGWGSFYLLQLVESIALIRRPGGLREPTLTVAFMLLGSCALLATLADHGRDARYRGSAWSGEPRYGAWQLALSARSAPKLAIMGIEKITWARHAPNTLQFAFMFFMWCNLYFSIKQWQQSVQERERLLHAETEVREARLQGIALSIKSPFPFQLIERRLHTRSGRQRFRRPRKCWRKSRTCCAPASMTK